MRLEDQRVMDLKNIGGFNAYNIQLAFKGWSRNILLGVEGKNVRETEN